MGVHEVVGVGDFVVDEGDGDGRVAGVGRALGEKGLVEVVGVGPHMGAGVWRDEGARVDEGVGDSRGRRRRRRRIRLQHCVSRNAARVVTVVVVVMAMAMV